jgi:hypothetical protein
MIATFPTESRRFGIQADTLQREMKWMETSKEVSPTAAITTHVIIWFLQVDAFRQQEEEALADGAYEKSLDEHRYILSQITSNGERLYLAAKQNHISKFSNNFTIEDIRVTLESLRLTSQCEYGEKNSEKINKEIRNLFSGAQPKN